MMRANLLPRPKESIALFGFDFDADYLRQALLGFAIAGAIALTGAGIETLRLQRYLTAAANAEAALLASSARRSETKRLALDVARYQEITREAAAVRESGPAAAAQIARLGNSVPSGVWLDSLAHSGGGFEVNGSSRSVDGLGRALVALGAAQQGPAASLLSIDNRNPEANGITFAARVPDPIASGNAR